MGNLNQSNCYTLDEDTNHLINFCMATIFCVYQCHDGYFEPMKAFVNHEDAYKVFSQIVDNAKKSAESLELYDEIGGEAFSCLSSDLRVRFCVFETTKELKKGDSVWLGAMGEQNKYFQIRTVGAFSSREKAHEAFVNGMKDIRSFMVGTYEYFDIPTGEELDAMSDYYISTEGGVYGFAEYVLSVQEVTVE